MGYLFDTCAMSALYKKSEPPKVVEKLISLPREAIFISALSIGELQRGIVSLPPSKERSRLTQWFELSVLAVFRPQVLVLDLDVALTWGTLRAKLISNGHTMQAIDSLIAATALAHDLTVVTRNESDFVHAGVRILNPWTS